MADLPAGRQARRTKMYYVYVINSIYRNYIYVGMTNCVARRLEQHQLGKEKTTAPYKPYKLILIEEFESRMDARKREKYLKSGCGKEWLKEKILKTL